jgi:thiol-disulfide isomerase/thioredoxin/uncharacterized membrane protein YphA (DoxX/SURF4 family)
MQARVHTGQYRGKTVLRQWLQAEQEQDQVCPGVSVLLLVSTALIAGVFVVAGFAKLLDPKGSGAATRAFGMPDRLAGVVALVLPVAEIAIAALLLPARTRWLAAIAALVLLLAFCAAIARAMARGEAPECHCFGQLHSAPAGWPTLARNGVFAAVSALLVVSGRDDAGPSVVAWTSSLGGVGWLVLALAVALAATIAIGGYGVLHVLRSYGHVLVRLERVEGRLRDAGFELDEPDDVPQLGVAPGTEAPAFSLDSLDSGRVDLVTLLEPGLPLLLLFTSPTCGPCTLLMPEVARWQREHEDALTVVLLNHGDEAAARAEAAAYGLERVLLDRDGAVSEAYEANGTPSAVLVGDDGAIASWLAAGSDWIETLVEQALAGDGHSTGLPIGSELPSLRLASLAGAETVLTDVVAESTVIVFWNPGCGFCRSMHEDVRLWEEHRPDGAPSLVVVSAGAVDDVRAEAFASTVLLDPEWTASAALGADGTPMAMLVDGDGRIASGLVTGAPAVLELLGTGVLSAAG